MLQYNLLEQRLTDDIEELEQAINARASEGWILDQIVAGETFRPNQGDQERSLLLVFKKEVAERRSRIR